MTRIGFIGLGIMGNPMARNLAAAGHDVIGLDRSSDAIERLVAAGGRGATSVAEAVSDADVVITMVPDSPDVEAVALGPDGILANAKPGSLLVDMSTVRPQTALLLATEAAAFDVRTLDAPVSGGEQGAVEASLSIMVGGAQADFDAALPLFRILGKTIALVGPNGSGQATKAANQLLVGGIIELVSEAMLLMKATGVDLRAGLEVLAGGLAGNRILDRKSESMLAHAFDPGFRVDLHHKDYGIVLAAARDAGIALPVSGLVAQLMAACRAQGNGHADHSSLLSVVEGLSALTVS